MTDLQTRISGVVLNRLADYGIRIDREIADSVAEAVMALPGIERQRLTSVGQLAALPTHPLECEGVVIKDANGEIYELDDDHTWSNFGARDIPHTKIKLPAILLWEPDAAEVGQ